MVLTGGFAFPRNGFPSVPLRTQELPSSPLDGHSCILAGQPCILASRFCILAGQVCILPRMSWMFPNRVCILGNMIWRLSRMSGIIPDDPRILANIRCILANVRGSSRMFGDPRECAGMFANVRGCSRIYVMEVNREPSRRFTGRRGDGKVQKEGVALIPRLRVRLGLWSGAALPPLLALRALPSEFL